MNLPLMNHEELNLCPFNMLHKVEGLAIYEVRYTAWMFLMNINGEYAPTEISPI